jgi:hypothetical protein
MTRIVHHRVVPLALAAMLVGCITGLDEPTLVKTTRILAIVADHPEVAPGQDVELRVLAFDPMDRELHYAFRACFIPSALFGGGSSNGSGGVGPAQQFCSPWSAPSTSYAWTMPGDFSRTLTGFIDMLPETGDVTRGQAEAVLATAGIALTVEVHVSVTGDDGTQQVLVTGTKEIGITTRADPTTNPPYIYFDVVTHVPVQSTDPSAVATRTSYIGGIDPAHPFDCVPWFGPAATAVASQPGAITDYDERHRDQVPNRVTFQPADDPTAWEESFPIYDFSGHVRTGYEGAYYSWYTTASLVDRHDVAHATLRGDVTQAPAHGADPSPIDATLRNIDWLVPREAGTYDVWLVERDGHLGTVACHFTIEVTAPP